jgi:hypothetical protein
MDDDRETDFLHTALARLLDYYIASGMEYIVGLRVRRFGFCGPPDWKLIEYSVCNWPQVCVPCWSCLTFYRYLFSSFYL